MVAGKFLAGKINPRKKTVERRFVAVRFQLVDELQIKILDNSLASSLGSFLSKFTSRYRC